MHCTVEVVQDVWEDHLERAPAIRVGSHCHEILIDSLLESDSCRGRVAQLGEHLLCKKAGKITQVPHLVSLTRKHAVQPTP